METEEVTDLTPAYLDTLIDQLSELDIDLLMDRTTNWGSWMVDSAKYMKRMGLCQVHNMDGGGISYQFDTPAAIAVKGRIETREAKGWTYKRERA